MEDYMSSCAFMWIKTCRSQTSAENIETQDEERNSTGSGPQTSYSTYRPTGPLRPPLHPFFPSAKSEVLRREQQKRTQSFKMEELPGPLITDQQNFSLETKQEPEYVSTTTNIFLSSEHTGGMFFSSSSVFWCFSPPAGDEMFWVAVVLMVGRHREQQNGIAVSGYDGPAADPGQAVVWPQGVRVPGVLGANEWWIGLCECLLGSPAAILIFSLAREVSTH